MNASMEMPRYVSHKKVWALQIASINEISVIGESEEGISGHTELLLTLVDNRYAPIQKDCSDRPQPSAGWYYVVYPDGYFSFSPADAFEGGYTLVGGR